MVTLPAYPKRKMKGNIGEALAQYVLSKFCLVHKIDGSNDIGNDFICELIKDEFPTNLLFYVQVKYTSRKPQIRKETLEYWKGSPIPVYVFWIKDSKDVSHISPTSFSRLEKYYKRYTPILHNPEKHSSQDFKPYNELEFKRDLIIDYARTEFFKGHTPVIEPRAFLSMDEKMSLRFPRYAFYTKDLVPEYSEQILLQSWASLSSAAVILYRMNTLESLAQARESVKLSIKLLQHADERKRAIFLEVLKGFEDKIEKGLAELNL